MTKYTAAILADILSVSKQTVLKWEKSGTLVPKEDKATRTKYFTAAQVAHFRQIQEMACSRWDEEQAVKPKNRYTSIELFAGAGGLALGLEKAGLHAVMLNEIDKQACETLRQNRPHWNVVEGDVA